MPRGIKTKKSVIDEIVRMYEEDEKSVLYIANYLLMSQMTVWKYLHERGAKMRKAGGGCYK